MENPAYFFDGTYWKDVQLFNHICGLHKFHEAGSIVCLGNIQTVRTVFDWENHKLELDDSNYGFAENWEIEVETEEPEQLKTKLETMLNKLAVQYGYSKASKFANFMNKKIAK